MAARFLILPPGLHRKSAVAGVGAEKQPPAPRPHEEGAFAQSIRRRRGAVRRSPLGAGEQRVFATFFTPEKGSGRSRLHKGELVLAARPNGV